MAPFLKHKFCALMNLVPSGILLYFPFLLMITASGTCLAEQAGSSGIVEQQVKVQVELGHKYISSGQYKEAKEAFREAIRIKPDYPEAHFGLGVVYGILNRELDEIEAYKQAIRLKPDYSEAYYYLGRAYSKLGNYTAEIDALNNAVSVKPDYAEAYMDLGNVYLRSRRYRDARNAYQQAVMLRPHVAEAHFYLGIVHLRLHDNGAAFDQYRILKGLDERKAEELFNQIYP